MNSFLCFYHRQNFANCKIIRQVAAQVQDSIKLHNVRALAKDSYTSTKFWPKISATNHTKWHDQSRGEEANGP